MSVWTWIGIAVSGALGAVCRYLVSVAEGPRLARRFPYSTLTVNVTGSFLLGLVVGSTGDLLPEGAGLVLGLGFCGAYTTFSTHMVDTLKLANERGLARAALNVVGSLILGLAAVALGLALAAGA